MELNPNESIDKVTDQKISICIFALAAETRDFIFQLAVQSDTGISLQVVDLHDAPNGQNFAIRFRPLGKTHGDSHPEIDHDGPVGDEKVALATWISLRRSHSTINREAYSTLFDANKFKIKTLEILPAFASVTTRSVTFH